MVTARRALAGLVMLGLVIALVVMQQRRGDAPAADLADGALPPTDDPGTQAAPAAAPATDRAPSLPSAGFVDDESARMCVQTLRDATAFAERERDAANPPEESEWSEDRYRAEVENLKRSLEGSRDPELFLATLLLDPGWRNVESNDPPDYAPLLELGLRAADSDSPLVAWHALRACVEAEEFCPFPHLEQSLLEIDRDNAEAWVLVATLRQRRGDVAGALAAIQDAARASTSTWYWAETIALVERSLAERLPAAQAPMPYGVRMGTAFGSAASALPYDSALTICSAESITNRAWAEACLALGTMRSKHNGTMLAEALAFGVRERALTALGDPEGAADVREEYELFSAGRMGGALYTTVSWSPVQSVLIETSPERFHAYLSAIQEFGEVAGARMFLRQELPPLIERAGLLERDGARECIAQLFEPTVAAGSFAASYRDYPVEEYPIQVGDRLQISQRGQGPGAWSLRIGADGMIRLRGIRDSATLGVPVVAAVGKTTAQLEREIATLLSERYPTTPTFPTPPRVIVTLVATPSPEELRLEFDNALSEAAESREEPR